MKRKKTGLIILFTVMITGTVFFGLNHIIQYMVSTSLKEVLNYQHPSRLYDYSFEGIKIDLWRGSIELDNAHLFPRKNILDSLKKINKGKRVYVEGRLEKINITQLDIIRLIVHKEISIDSFLIQQPQIKLYIDTDVKEIDGDKFTKDFISQTLTYGKINTFVLSNAEMNWIHANKDSSIYFSCDSVNIKATDLYTDSIVIKNPQPLQVSSFTFDGNNFNFNYLNDFTIQSKQISFDYRSQLLWLKDFYFSNKKNKIQFTNDQAFEKEWYKINIKELSVRSNNILDWMDEDYFELGKLHIDHPVITIYRDKRLTDPPYHVKNLPSQTIREIPFPLLIDTIEITNGKITYQEIVETGKVPGEVFFTNLSIKSYNLTNVKKIVQINPEFNISASAKFMGQASVKLSLKFPLADKQNTFYAKGSLNDIDVTSLNGILSNMAYAEFLKGRIHHLAFDITANETQARGTLDAHYTHLKIRLLDTTELFRGNEYREKKLEGFAANLLLKRNNIPNTNHYRQGQIILDRPKNKFILNYVWKSIRAGLVSTLVNPRLNKELEKRKH